MTLAHKLTPALSAAGVRVGRGLWPVAQQTAAAAVSWGLASAVTGHQAPIFAPITTLVALNADRGGRGSNAVRFVIGVILGVVIASWATDLLGHGVRAVALAVALSLLAALIIGGERIIMAQAGVNAIVAVVTGTQAGFARVIDALFGAAVALVFSQVLFPAHPLALLRRAESAILADLSAALAWTARAMAAGPGDSLDWARGPLRAAYAQLAELSEARDRATVAAVRAPVWWGQREPIARECDSAAQLDLLSNSCLTVTRTAIAMDTGTREAFAADVRELSEILASLVGNLDRRAVRQHAAERVAALARRGAEAQAWWPAVELLLFDILVFLGVGPGDADLIVRDQHTDVRVAPPPALNRPVPQRFSNRRSPDEKGGNREGDHRGTWKARRAPRRRGS
ncbi:FUSC family protein [Nocardia sp. NPDC127579]|uniref:FUSC family protein n=1 Tax=Nocardia sp. NPDC127579 TaxID=3345402 RepID=UPI00362DABA0